MSQQQIQNIYSSKKPIKFCKKLILYEMSLNQDESQLICVTQNKIITIEIKDKEFKKTTIKMNYCIPTICIHKSYLLLVEEYCKLQIFEMQQDFTNFKSLSLVFKSQINPLTIPSFHGNQNLICFCNKNKFYVHNFINNTLQYSFRCQGKPKMCSFYIQDFLFGVEQHIIQTGQFYSLKTNKIYKKISFGYSIMNRCQIINQILILSSSNELKVFNIHRCKLLFKKSYQQQQRYQYVGQQLMKIYLLNDCSLEILSFKSRKIIRVIFIKNPKGFKVSQDEKTIYVLKSHSIGIWNQSD